MPLPGTPELRALALARRWLRLWSDPDVGAHDDALERLCALHVASYATRRGLLSESLALLEQVETEVILELADQRRLGSELDPRELVATVDRAANRTTQRRRRRRSRDEDLAALQPQIAPPEAQATSRDGARFVLVLVERAILEVAQRSPGAARQLLRQLGGTPTAPVPKRTITYFRQELARSIEQLLARRPDHPERSLLAALADRLAETGRGRTGTRRLLELCAAAKAAHDARSGDAGREA